MLWIHIVTITLVYVHEPKTLTWAKECEIPDYAYSEKRRKNQYAEEWHHLDDGLQQNTGNPPYESKLVSINTRKKIDDLTGHAIYPRYHHTNSIVHTVLQIPTNQSTYHKLLYRYQPYGYGAYAIDSSKNIFNIYVPNSSEESPKDLILPSMQRGNEETVSYNTRDDNDVSTNVNVEINTSLSLLELDKNTSADQTSTINIESSTIPLKASTDLTQPSQTNALNDIQTDKGSPENKIDIIQLEIPIEKTMNQVDTAQQEGNSSLSLLTNNPYYNKEKLDLPYESLVHQIMNVYNSSDHKTENTLVELNDKLKQTNHNIISGKTSLTQTVKNISTVHKDQTHHTNKAPVSMQKKHLERVRNQKGKLIKQPAKFQKKIQTHKEQNSIDKTNALERFTWLNRLKRSLHKNPQVELENKGTSNQPNIEHLLNNASIEKSRKINNVNLKISDPFNEIPNGEEKQQDFDREFNRMIENQRGRHEQLLDSSLPYHRNYKEKREVDEGLVEISATNINQTEGDTEMPKEGNSKEQNNAIDEENHKDLLEISDSSSTPGNLNQNPGAEESTLSIKEDGGKNENLFNNETMSEMTAEVNSTEFNKEELRPLSSLKKLYKKFNFFRSKVKGASKVFNHSLAELEDNNLQYFNNFAEDDESTVSKGVRNFGTRVKSKYKQEFDDSFMLKWMQLQQAYMSHLEKHIPPTFPPIKACSKIDISLKQFPVELARNISQEFPIKLKEGRILGLEDTNNTAVTNTKINEKIINATMNDAIINYATVNSIRNGSIIQNLTAQSDKIMDATMVNDTINEMLQETLGDSLRNLDQQVGNEINMNETQVLELDVTQPIEVESEVTAEPSEVKIENGNKNNIETTTENTSFYYLEGAAENSNNIVEAMAENLNVPDNKKRDIHCCFKLNEGQPYQENEYNSEQLKQIDLKIEDKKKKGSPLKETSIEMVLTKNKMFQGPSKARFGQHVQETGRAFTDEMQPFQVIIKNDSKNQQVLSNAQGMKEFNKLYNLAKVDKNKDKWDRQIKKLYEIISEEKKEIERNKTTYSSLHKMLDKNASSQNEETIKLPTNDQQSKIERDPYLNIKHEIVNTSEFPKENRLKGKYKNKKYIDKQLYEDIQRIHQQLEPKPPKKLLKNAKAHRTPNVPNSITSCSKFKNIKSKYRNFLSKVGDDFLKEELDENNNPTSSYSNDKDFYIEGIKFNKDQLGTILQALDKRLDNENATNDNIIYSEPLRHYNRILANDSDEIKEKLLRKCENIKSNISYILNLMNDLQDEGRSNPESMSSCLQSTGFDSLLNNLRRFNRIQYFSTTNGKDFARLNPGNGYSTDFQNHNINQYKNSFGKNLRGTSKEDSEALKEVDSLSGFGRSTSTEAMSLEKKIENASPWSELEMSTVKIIENDEKINIYTDSVNSKINDNNVTSIDDETQLKTEAETENKKESIKENYLNIFRGEPLEISAIKKPADQTDIKKSNVSNENTNDILNNKKENSSEESSTDNSTKVTVVQGSTSENNLNNISEKEPNLPHESLLDTISGKSIIKLVQKETPGLFNGVDKVPVMTMDTHQEDSKEDKETNTTMSPLNITIEPNMLKLESFPSISKNLTKFNTYRVGTKKKIVPEKSTVFDVSKFNQIANHMQDIPHKVSMPIIIDILNSLMPVKGSEINNDEKEMTDHRLKRQNYGHYINIPANKEIEINMKVKKGRKKKTKKYKTSYNKLMRSKTKKNNKLLVTKNRNKEKMGQSTKTRVKQIYMPNFRNNKGMRIVPPFLFGDNVITINVTPCENYFKRKKNMKISKKPNTHQDERKNNETSMVTETKYFLMSNVNGEVTEKSKVHHETQLRLPLRFFRFKLGTSATPTSTEGQRRKYSTKSPPDMTQAPFGFETNDFPDEQDMIKSAWQEFKGKTLAQVKAPVTTSLPFMKSKLNVQVLKTELEKMKAVQELSLLNKMGGRAYELLKKIPTQKNFTPMEIYHHRTMTESSISTLSSRQKEHEFTFAVTLKPNNLQNMKKPNENTLTLSTVLPPLETSDKVLPTSTILTDNIFDQSPEENKVLDSDYEMDYFSTETQSDASESNTQNNQEATKEIKQSPQNLLSIDRQPNNLLQTTTEKNPIQPIPTLSLFSQTNPLPNFTELNINSIDVDELKSDESLNLPTEFNTIELDTQPATIENPPITESMDDLVINFEEQTEIVTESEKDVFVVTQEEIDQNESIKEAETQPNTEMINPADIPEAKQQEDDTTEIQYDDELETVMESFGEKPKVAQLFQPPLTTEAATTDTIPESEHEDILNEFLEYEMPSQSTDQKQIKLDELPQNQYNMTLKQETQPQKETTNQDTDESEESPQIEKDQNNKMENNRNFQTEKEKEKQNIFTTAEENFSAAPYTQTTMDPSDEQINKLDLNNDQIFTTFDETKENDDESKEEDDDNKDEDLEEGESINMMELTDVTTKRQNLVQFGLDATSRPSMDLESDDDDDDDVDFDSNDFQDLAFWQNVTKNHETIKENEKSPAALDMSMVSAVNQNQPNVTETNVSVDIQSMKLELEQLKELLDKSPLADKMDSLKNLAESSHINFTQKNTNDKLNEEHAFNRGDNIKKLSMHNINTNELVEGNVNETYLAEKNIIDAVDRQINKFDTENIDALNYTNEYTAQNQEITTSSYYSTSQLSTDHLTDSSVLQEIDDLEFEIANSPPVPTDKENGSTPEESDSSEAVNPYIDPDTLETLQNMDKDEQDSFGDSSNDKPIDDSKTLNLSNEIMDDENLDIPNEIMNRTNFDDIRQTKLDLGNNTMQIDLNKVTENQWTEQNGTNLEESISQELTNNNTRSDNDHNSVILLDNIYNVPSRWVLHDDSVWQVKPWQNFKPPDNEIEDSIKSYLQKNKLTNNSPISGDLKYLRDRDNILNLFRSNGLRDSLIHHSNKYGKIIKAPVVRRNQSKNSDQRPHRKYIKSRSRSNKNLNAAHASQSNVPLLKDEFGRHYKRLNTHSASRNNSGILIIKKAIENKIAKDFVSAAKKLNMKKNNFYAKNKSNKAQLLKSLKQKGQANIPINRKSLYKNNMIQGKEFLSKIHGSSTALHNKYVLKNQSRENATESQSKNQQPSQAGRNSGKLLSSASCPSNNQSNRRIKSKATWQKVNQLGYNYNKIDKLDERNLLRKNHSYQKNAFLANPKLLSQGKSILSSLRKSNPKGSNFFKQRLNKKMNQLKTLQNKNKDAKITPAEEKKIKQILDGIICRYKGHTNDTEEENFMRFKASKLNMANKKNMTKIRNHNKYSRMGLKLDKTRLKSRSKDKIHSNSFIDPRLHQRLFANGQKKPFSGLHMFTQLTKNCRRVEDLSAPMVKNHNLLSSGPELLRYKKNYLLGTPVIRTIPNKNAPGFMSVINTQVKKLPNATNLLGTSHNKGNLQYKMDDGLEQMALNEMLKNHTGAPIQGILSLVYPEDITNNMTQNNDFLGGAAGYSGNLNEASYSSPGMNFNNQFNNKQFEELLTSLEKDNGTDNARYKEFISFMRDNQKEASKNKTKDEEELKAKMKAIKWLVNFKNGQGQNKTIQLKAESLAPKQEGFPPSTQIENKEREDDMESMKKFITKYKVLLKMFEEQHGRVDKEENQKLVKNRDELLTKDGSMLVQRPIAVTNIWKKTKSKERIPIRLEEGARNLLLDNTSKKKPQKMYLIGQNKQRKEMDSSIDDLPDNEGSYFIKHLQDDDDYDNLENCNDIEIESYDESQDKIKDPETAAMNASQILQNITGFLIKDSSHLQSLPSGLINKYKINDKYKGYHNLQGQLRPKSYKDDTNLKLNCSAINKMFKSPINPLSYIGEVNYDKCKANWDNWTLDRTLPPSAKLKPQMVTDDPQINLTQDHNVPVVQASNNDDKEGRTNDNVLMLPIKFNTSDFIKLLNFKEVNDSDSGYQDYEPNAPSRKTKLWDSDNRSSYIFDVDKGGPNGIKNRYYITFDSLSPNTVKVKNVSTIPVSNFSNFVNKGNPNLNVVSIRKVVSPWDRINMSHNYINNKNVKGYLRPEIRSIEKVCLWLRKPLSYNLTHQVPKVAISLGEVWPPMAEGQGPRNMKHYLVQVDPLITLSKYPNQHIDYPSQISKVVWKAILHGFKTPKKAWQLTNQLG